MTDFEPLSEDVFRAACSIAYRVATGATHHTQTEEYNRAIQALAKEVEDRTKERMIRAVEHVHYPVFQSEWVQGNESYYCKSDGDDWPCWTIQFVRHEAYGEPI